MMIRCALVIGHKWQSTGAFNQHLGISEFQYNHLLARSIERMMVMRGIQINIIIVYRDHYRDLPGKINSANPDFIISMHCNAYNQRVSGTEVLYLRGSEKGKSLAKCLHQKLVRALQLPDRGIKPKDTEARGGYLLRYTHAPCVIAEPFFIDNVYDLQTAIDNESAIIDAYIECIVGFMAA